VCRLMSQQGGFEHRQLLVGHQPSEALLGLHHAGSSPAQEPSRQRFTLRLTCRIVPFMFSMMLVQARERRRSLGRTHRISSIPSRMVAAMPGHSLSSRRFRISCSALLHLPGLPKSPWRAPPWADARQCCGPCEPGSAGSVCSCQTCGGSPWTRPSRRR
jgi:hypothetical protein